MLAVLVRQAEGTSPAAACTQNFCGSAPPEELCDKADQSRKFSSLCEALCHNVAEAVPCDEAAPSSVCGSGCDVCAVEAGQVPPPPPPRLALAA